MISSLRPLTGNFRTLSSFGGSFPVEFGTRKPQNNPQKRGWGLNFGCILFILRELLRI